MCTDTLIICTRNRNEDLILTLKSLLSEISLPQEIIFVDSSDNDLTENLVSAFVKQTPSTVKYFRTRAGLTYQRNFGIRESTGKILHFIDDDVDLDPNYFLEINRTFSDNPDVFAVGGKLLNTTGLLDKFIRRFFMLSSTNGSGTMKRSGFPDFQWENSRVKTAKHTSILVGCSCSYRREVFQALSFDEFFQGYGFMEDVDFSFSASKKFTCIYNPGARLYHRITNKSRTDLFRLYRMMNLNHNYVFHKHIGARPVNRICFVIAKLGIFFQAIKASLSSKSLDAINGFVAGAFAANSTETSCTKGS